MGTGRVLHSELSIAKKRQDFDVGIVEPYFLGRNMSASADVFSTHISRFSTYTQKNVGLNLGIGYMLSENWSQSFSYGIKQENVGHIFAFASPYIRTQAGNFLTSSLTHSIAYDRRDSRRTPTSGYVLSLSNSYAGLGGNVNYLKNTLGASWFYSFVEDVVLNVRGEAGHIERVNNKPVRIVDSVMMGADNFRGFEFGGLGPRDANTKDALGGTRYWTSTAELQFPIGLPNEFGVKGAVFTDIGSLWRPGMYLPNAPVLDKKSIRASVGAGLSWDSPFGPVRIDYSRPVKKEKYDNEQRILFGFSTRF
jgi:outer membrane protein insertion porin family